MTMSDDTKDLLWIIGAWVLLVLLILVTAGCAPGQITNHRVESWSAQTKMFDLGNGVKAVVISPVKGESDQRTTVTQPDGPAGAATLTTPTASASIPPAYQPAGPESSASKGLGSMVYWGMGLIVLGALGLGLRFAPWGVGAIASKVSPVGLSTTLIGAGAALILLATVMDTAPWWATYLLFAGAIAVGLFVAMRDNWKKVQAAAPIAAAKAVAQAAPITANINGGAS